MSERPRVHHEISQFFDFEMAAVRYFGYSQVKFFTATHFKSNQIQITFCIMMPNFMEIVPCKSL